MVVVTESWTEKTYTRANSAVRVFVVTGVDNEDVACQAQGVPSVNSSHPHNLFLHAMAPAVKLLSSVIYEVTITYTILPTTTRDPNPLNEPPTYSFQIGSTTEQIELDADGYPMVNSAGDAFDPRLTDEVATWHLTITRNEQSYDIAKAFRFGQKVNASAINIPQVGTVPPLCALCRGIMPTCDYKPATATYVPIGYLLEFRVPVTANELAGTCSPFDHRPLDQGYRGWYSKSGVATQGDFYDPTDLQRVGHPIRLDGTGKPLDTTTKYTVGGSVKTQVPIAFATPPIPQLFEKGTGQAAFALFIRYPRKKRIDFSGLGLF